MAVWRRRRGDVPNTASDNPLIGRFVLDFGHAAAAAHGGDDDDRMNMAMLAASVDIGDLTGLAEQGDPDAAYALAIALQVQHPRKKAKFTQWLRTAAEAGNTNAMYDLGQELYDGGDAESALSWLQRAADAGDDTAAGLTANLLVMADRWTDALPYARRAVDAGDAEQAGILAMLLISQDQVVEAMPYARQAADVRNPQSAALLGDRLRELGDLTGARTWYRIAERAGDAGAAVKLAALPDEPEVD